ncbi:MAG: reverse gyrase [Elusimicrobiota bacterium]|nr:reverse gyrase [Endomicrobiia bacterium]MDW8166433.1 reverse gyrase [Elusimicrobiota bacterium]
MPLAIFKNLCPNCGGAVTSERLEAGLVCEKCLSSIDLEDSNYLKYPLYEILRIKGNLKNYKWMQDLKETEKIFESFFKKNFGFDLWSLQKVWSRRVFLKESFALVAPTGVGKTTFGVAMACFISGSAYIIVPTKTLVKQTFQKCKIFNNNKKIVSYLGKKSEKDAIKNSEYDILITTSKFLSTNFNLLINRKFDFIFVDDVDSLLKSGKNVDKVLMLLGFSQEEIKSVYDQLFKRKQSSILKNTELLEESEEIEAKEVSTNLQQEAKSRGVLVVSSATLRPKTKRVALFKALLGFEISPVRVTLRNICDSVKFVKDLEEAKLQLVDWINFLGDGGVIFVTNELGREGVKNIISYLKEKGIDAESYDKFDLEAFRSGKVKVLVGISISINALVRGIDLPDTIRYAIFIDVPKMILPVNLEDPRNFLSLLLALREISDDKTLIDSYLSIIRQYNNSTYIKQNLPKKIQKIAEYLKQQFSDEKILKKLEDSETVTLLRNGDKLSIVFADAATYLQASGRTSRLFAGGISRGLSILLTWDKKAFNSLTKRLKLFNEEVKFYLTEEVDWKKEINKVDEDRKKIKQFFNINMSFSSKVLPKVQTILVVVESPTKARTIAHFFGTPQRRIINNISVWEVTTGDKFIAIVASAGHVFDLVEREGIYGVMQIEGSFVPIYSSIKFCLNCSQQTTEENCPCGEYRKRDKLELIQTLQKIVVQFDQVIIATDPDAEGEKISYDLMVALKPFNSNIVRAEFHEVTRRAFVEAIHSPRNVEINLVKAQLTRRILDRWVGFELSKRLWQVFNRHDLSAGRVQTPVLGWVIERTDLLRKKKALIILNIKDLKTNFNFSLSFEEEDIILAREIFGKLEKANFVISEFKEETINPPSPFNTATLLAESGSFISATKLMEILQELFEKGLITYHRTDSIHVSDTGLKIAEELLKEHYNLDIFQPRHYSSEGAHECIRPTKPLTEDDLRLWISTGRISFKEVPLTLKIYGMILNRFLASQMKSAIVKKIKLLLTLENWTHEWELIESVLQDGFNKVLPFNIYKLSSELKIINKQLKLISKVRPFTQGSLIDQMRQRGLGRPSTYAKIVQTLIERGYIFEHKGYLFATDLGREVYKWLNKNFPEFSSEDLTKDMEIKEDKIETGELEYQNVLLELSKSRLFNFYKT